MRRYVSLSLGILLNWRRPSPTGFSAPQINLQAIHARVNLFQNWGIDSIREIVVGSYRLIYRIRLDEVELLTLHHGARLFDSRTIAGV